MKDHDAPAQDELDALLDAFAPDTPFAHEVEQLLSASGGPVPVDEAALNAAVARLDQRIQPARATSSRGASRVFGLLAAAGLLAYIATRSAPSAPDVDAPTVAQAPTPQPFETSSDALELGPEATARVLGDTLLLDRGTVRFQRDASHTPSVQTVTLSDTGLSFAPIGTTFVAGRSETCAALGVREGRVEVRDGEQVLGTVDASGWWVRCPEGTQQFVDGDVRSFDQATQQLLAELRWLSLPAETRALLER